MERRSLRLRMIVGTFVSVALASACVQGPSREPRPIPAREDYSFEALLSITPAPTEPALSPSVGTDAPGTASAPTGGPRSEAAAPAAAPSSNGGSERVVCPSGRVAVSVTDLQAEDTGEESKSGETKWRIVVRGTVTNNTTQAVRDVRVRVGIHTDNAKPETGTAVVSGLVGVGTTVGWTSSHKMDSNKRPRTKDAQVSVSGWSWGDPVLAQCPT